MDIIKQVVEIFPYAVAGSVIAGIICSFLGVFILSQRIVFLGAALTQASIAGVAFSFLHLINFENFITSVLGITVTQESFLHHFEPAFFSLAFALITVLIFSQTHGQKFSQDAVLGIIFAAAIAFRIIFIQKSPVAEVSEIESILKGDILFIGPDEFYMLAGILTVVVLVFVLFQKHLKIILFDTESADAQGISSNFWMLLFYLIVGTGISLTTRYVGDVFTFAYLIIPSSIGILLGKSLVKVFMISVITGAVLPPVSLFLAFKYDLSSGPMAVVIAFTLYLVVLIIKKTGPKIL